MIKKFMLLSIAFLLFSCRTTGNTENKALYRNKTAVVRTLPQHTVTIDVINNKSEVEIFNIRMGTTPLTLTLPEGEYPFKLIRKDYEDQNCLLEIREDKTVHLIHHRKAAPFYQVGVLKTGVQPKQVLFSPENDSLYVPLLEDKGFQVFSMKDLTLSTFAQPPKYDKSRGFVEGLFIPSKKSFFVSQMNNGTIHEYRYPEIEYIRTVKTQGQWSKFLAWSEQNQWIAVSNWLSNDITILNYSDGSLVTKIKTPPAPRGMIFSSDSKYLYAACFDGATFLKIQTSDWTVVKKMSKHNAAYRHIVLINDQLGLVSDMHHHCVYEINLETFEILRTYEVDLNPNTIELTPDNRYLMVSSRGPNDPESYLRRSPRSGLISVIDLEEKKVIYQFEGGNQPTGLDISPNGKYLCFTNFRDDNMEIYRIDRRVHD